MKWSVYPWMPKVCEVVCIPIDAKGMCEVVMGSVVYVPIDAKGMCSGLCLCTHGVVCIPMDTEGMFSGKNHSVVCVPMKYPWSGAYPWT